MCPLVRRRIWQRLPLADHGVTIGVAVGRRSESAWRLEEAALSLNWGTPHEFGASIFSILGSAQGDHLHLALEKTHITSQPMTAPAANRMLPVRRCSWRWAGPFGELIEGKISVKNPIKSILFCSPFLLSCPRNILKNSDFVVRFPPRHRHPESHPTWDLQEGERPDRQHSGLHRAV